MYNHTRSSEISLLTLLLDENRVDFKHVAFVYVFVVFLTTDEEAAAPVCHVTGREKRRRTREQQLNKQTHSFGAEVVQNAIENMKEI